MKRFPCLVLDANQLFHLGLWDEVAERCELILSETVVDEADFFVDSQGVGHSIDLQPDIDAGRIRVIALTLAEITEFRSQFDPLYVQKLGDGETESLAYCLREGDPHRLCTSDAIVFAVLAGLPSWPSDRQRQPELDPAQPAPDDQRTERGRTPAASKKPRTWWTSARSTRSGRASRRSL